MNEIDAFRQRRSDRIRERYSKIARMDADEREPEEEDAPKNHGNTRLPYGLCEKHGINLPQGATPHDAWAALEGKGYSVPWKDTPEGQKTASEIKGGKTAGETPEAKTPEAPKSLKERIENIKTYDDVADALKEMNIDTNGMLDKCGTEALKGMCRTLEKFTKDFDKVFGKNGYRTESFKISFEPQKAKIACASTNLYLGKAFESDEKMKTTLEANTKKRTPEEWRNHSNARLKINVKDGAGDKSYWVDNSSADSIVAHELAHCIDYYLSHERAVEENGGNPLGSWQQFEFITEKWNKEKTVGAEIVKEAVKEYKTQTKSKLTQKELMYQISGQAANRPATECFAEAIGDIVANGENANGLSKLIYKKMVECYSAIGG